MEASNPICSSCERGSKGQRPSEVTRCSRIRAGTRAQFCFPLTCVPATRPCSLPFAYLAS